MQFAFPHNNWVCHRQGKTIKILLKTCILKTCMLGVSFCSCLIEKLTVSRDKHPIVGEDAYRTKVDFKFVLNE